MWWGGGGEREEGVGGGVKLQNSNTLDKSNPSKILQKDLPGSEQCGAVLEKNNKEIFRERQLPISL